MNIEVDAVATPLSEADARRYFKEMMLGIEYCKMMKISEREDDV